MVLKTDFTRGQENAQDPLNDNFQQLAPLIEDTGWVDIELLNGTTTTKEILQFRLKNGIVHFRGALGKEAQVGTNIAISPARIPVEYAPSRIYRYRVAQGSSVASEAAMVNITTEGYIQVVSRSNDTKATYLDGCYYFLD